MINSIDEGQDVMSQGIENCIECHAICVQTVGYAIESGSSFSPAHIQVLQDCADICQVAANFMLRDSERHMQVCDICADICESCAVACEGESEDELMQVCAEVCRACADSCRAMS